MPLPLLATLHGLAAAETLTKMVGGRIAKTTSRDMEHVAQDFQKGSKAIKALVNVSEGKPADASAELALQHPAEAWAHRGKPAWFHGKTVKVAFNVPGPSVEYLWVKVVGTGHPMVGQLLTQPVLVEASVGSALTFKSGDIVDVQLGAPTGKRRTRRRKR
jgi:hypothetical protein